MPISLNKLNEIYKHACREHAILAGLGPQFDQICTYEEWENPFKQSYKYAYYIGEIKDKLEAFLIRRFQEAFCAHVDLYSLIGHYREWFTEESFDCVKFVEKLKSFVSVDPERIVYEALRYNARRFFSFPMTYLNEENYTHYILKKIAVQATFDTNAYSLQALNVSALFHFETFAMLILENQNIFQKVAPSEIVRKSGLVSTITNVITSNQCHNGFFKCNKNINKYIDKARIYQNGRIDIYFHREDHVHLVMKALAGAEPNVYFPEREIDFDQMFVVEDERRRVVKR